MSKVPRGSMREDEFGERLARIEGVLAHLATKKDIESMKVWMLAGAIGGLLTIFSILRILA